MTHPQYIDVFNPATGKKIETVRAFRVEEARQALDRARLAQKRWAATPLAERVSIVRKFRDILLDNAEEISQVIAMENGKVLQEAFEMEVFPIVDLATYFADRASKILAPKKISLHLLKHRRSYIHYKPRGVVLVISPWNFPFSIPYGEVIMALLAGNAVLLKPASLTPLACIKGRHYFDLAGLDPDLFQVLPCSGSIASKIIEMGVDYVNFTGSTAVGQKVAALCTEHWIPFSMELGGKDPAIVLPDADLDLTAGSLVWGAFANAGQICASIERAYVHESIYDELLDKVVQKVERLRVGNPLEDGTDMGPMTDVQQLEVVHRQVQDALEKGAKVLTGGSPLHGPGQFYPPTVLVNVDHSMDIVREESFGPILPIMSYQEVEQAIEWANDSQYGLNAYVYGKDKIKMRWVAEKLEAGTVMINETLITHACPETPWGGVKASGMGRIHSDDGLRDLTIAYHVNEELTPTPAWSPFWQPYSHKMYHTLIETAKALQYSDWKTRAKSTWSALKRIRGIFDE